MKKLKYIIPVIIALAACKKETPAPAATTNNNTTPTTTSCDASFALGFKFNSDLQDTSCNNNDATGISHSFVADRNNKASKAVSFNGSSSYLEFPNASSVHPSFPFSIAFWVNPSDSAATSNHFIQAQVASTYYGYWIQTIAGTGELAANIGDGTGSSSGNRNSGVSSVRLRSNTWTHVTVVFNAANNFQMYFNGVADNAVTYSGSATSIAYLPTTTATAKGRIGGYSGAATTYFNGKLDNIKIWSKALTNTEVTSEYNLTN